MAVGAWTVGDAGPYKVYMVLEAPRPAESTVFSTVFFAISPNQLTF